MRKKSIGKIFFYVLIFLVLVTFLISFSTFGCGRRALLREKLKSIAESNQSQSESGQPADEGKTVKEDAGTEEDEKIVEESVPDQEEVTTQDGSGEEEETDDETAEETLPDEESVDQEEEEPVGTTIYPVDSECAYIEGDDKYCNGSIIAGDIMDNDECTSYISYDISELSGCTISAASIVATVSQKNGTPFETYGPLLIKAIYWGLDPITLSALDLDGIELANFTTADFTIDNEILRGDLQNVVNSGSERYQITLYFEMNETDGDSESDNISYLYENVKLNVTYIPNAAN